MKITTKLVSAAMGKCMPARYVVKVDGVEVGLVEKYKTTRTEIHPWRAFAGIGETRFIKAFYAPDGGKTAAIRAVVEGSMAKRPLDLTDEIIAFESGELDEEQTIDLFQNLINTGLAWQLQGSYGRMAAGLIKAGHCTP